MKWEYWVNQFFLRDGVTQTFLNSLNEAGEAGWELVSVTQAGSFYTVFFKRPKPT